MHIIYPSDEMYHYGTPRHSGRYPWGSGQNPYQHGSGSAFLEEYRSYQNMGLSDTEISRKMGISTTEFRRQRSLYRNEEKAARRAACLRMRDHGYSQAEISKKLGIPARTVSSILNESYGEKMQMNENTVNQLKMFADKHEYLDVGEAVAGRLGVSQKRLELAIDTLSKEGYHVEKINVPTATDSNKATTMLVLVKDGVTKSDVWENRDKIVAPFGTYTEDNGRTWENIKDPVSISSDRIMVRYGPEGGLERDGLIELRRGVGDIALGQNSYAQVRIAVDGTHYLKGMAVYSDDLPPGVDIRFNTNKDPSVPMIGPDKDNTVLKPLKDDKDNPFGSTIRQRDYIGEDGKPHQSAINLVNEDEDWANWNKTVASQVLSKQSPELAKRQLGIVYDNKKSDYNDISKVTVPAVKEKLLQSLADDCDSSAVHLKAAAFPRQATQVILPVASLKDGEVYAPNFRNGEKIALIRYPHQGKFEIPILTVNNNNKEGREMMGNASTFGIGINHDTAQRLSGADFDGDTVTAIPLNTANIKNQNQLKQLVDFDPQRDYQAYEGMTRVGEGDGFQKQKQMGMISNLNTDAQLKGASPDEIARITKHAQVVIDAEKHNLNWKQSEMDNGIQALKDKYQPKDDPNKKGGGASTLISKAKGTARVHDRTDTRRIDEKGDKIYLEKAPYETYSAKVDGKKKRVYLDYKTGEYYYLSSNRVINDNGRPVKERINLPKDTDITTKINYHTIESTNMAETKDARTLSSGTVMENVYADHANKLKQLARDCRLEAASIKAETVDKNAALVYEDEINSLKNKLAIVEANRPKERQAQAIASKIIDDKLYAKDSKGNYLWDEDGNKVKLYDEDHETKMRQRVITEARARVGAQSKNPKADNNISIYVSDAEWEAIQAHALPTTTLRKILGYADMDRVRELAITKGETKGLSSSKVSRARALISRGYSQAEVADMLGVSVSTLRKYNVI